MRSSFSVRLARTTAVLVASLGLTLTLAVAGRAGAGTAVTRAVGAGSAGAASARSLRVDAVRTGASQTIAPTGAPRAASSDGWRIALIRHYGSAHNASGYSAVVAPGGSGAWVFGGTNPGGDSAPVALRWNGSRWRSWPLPAGLTGFISNASASSDRNIWAVSYAGGYALYWNGKRWSVARRWHQHDALTGVTALSPTDVWVFGTTAAGVHGMGTWHFNGRAWARVKGFAEQISRASAASRRDIWAIAATRKGGLVEYFDGRTWRRAPTGQLFMHVRLDDVLAVSRRNVWVVGNLTTRRGEGRLVVAHFNGRRWIRIMTRWHADTGRLAPAGLDGVWVTADNSGASNDALIGHVSGARPPTWVIVQQGLGCGISGIAASRKTGAVWISGGFLTRVGGDAAVWSRRWSRPSTPARSDQIPVGEPLEYRSQHLDER